MPNYGLVGIRSFPTPLFRGMVKPRGCGQSFRATVAGERHNFRTMDYLGLRKEGVAYLERQLSLRKQSGGDYVDPAAHPMGLDEVFHSWTPIEGVEEVKPVLIYPVFQDHSGVYYMLKDYHRLHPDRPVVIFNLDAHYDRNDYDGPVNCGNWAQSLQDDGLGMVVPLSSYFDEMHLVKKKVNWNTPAWRDAIRRLVADMTRGAEAQCEIWLTICYDAFSLDAPERGGGKRKRMHVYHFGLDTVRQELMAVASFLEEMGLPLTQVLPASSPEFLNQGVLSTVGQAEDYIWGVTRLIREVF